MALVAASAASWAAHLGLTMTGCGRAPCKPIPTSGEEVLSAIVFVGLLHLALLVSPGLDRSGWLARLLGVLVLLPTSIGAAVYAAMVMGSLGSPYPEPLTPVNALVFALAHAAQLWRLAGFRIPPLHALAAPLADSSERDWYPAQGG